VNEKSQPDDKRKKNVREKILFMQKGYIVCGSGKERMQEYGNEEKRKIIGITLIINLK